MKDEGIEKRLKIIKATNIYRIIWDIVILTLAIIKFVLIPIEVAWTPEFTTGPAYMLFDYLFDFFFLFDILFNFRTSIIRNGEEILSPKEITQVYMFSSTFVMDVLCII